MNTTKEMKKNVILSFISWLLLLSLAIAGLAVIARDEAYELPGDGFEYLMMPVSIMNHGSTYVTDQDIEDAKAYYGNNIFDTIYRDREDVTLVEGADGNHYAKHFGLYSVICMPLRGLFHAVGMNPAKSFQYMNLLMWIGACLLIQLLLKADQTKKTLLMVFMVLNPSWFYLNWVHTEILIFSLAVASLVMLHNKNYVISMLLMSLSAMNNLTLLVPALIIGIRFLMDAYKDNGRKIKTVIRKTLPVAVAAIPGFVPIVRSFMLFGSYSPISAVASVSSSDFPADNRLICALSYIFDPNQGMIAYTLLIAPVFIVLVIVNLIKRRNVADTVLCIILVAGMLFIVSQEMHINCGMAYIMRYNVWILPFMAFFNVFNLKSSVAAPVFSISGAYTLVILIAFTFFQAPNLYLDHTLIGRFALSNFPSVYNPPVGIYYSRTLTYETYYCEFPVPYFDEEGNLRKILITPEAEELLDNGEWTIYDDNNEPVDFRTLPSTNINGEAFTYVNISADGYHMVRDMDKLDFSDLTENDQSLIRTPMGFEGDVGLIYGRSLRLLLHVKPGNYHGSFVVNNVFGGVQDVIVKVNGVEVFHGPVHMDDGSIDFDYTVSENYLCDIVVEVPGAFAPSSVLFGSPDDRILSLYLEEFLFSKES